MATLGLAAGSRDLPRTACKQVVTVEKHFVSDSKKKKKKKNSWFPDTLREEQSRAVLHDQWWQYGVSCVSCIAGGFFPTSTNLRSLKIKAR